jgi:hypothetical protein
VSQHFADQAGAIAQLAADDPERIAAAAHARECDECARALRSGERLFQAFAELEPPEPPSQALLSRIKNEIHADLTRAPEKTVVLERPLPIAAAVAVAFVLGSVITKHHDATASRWIVALLIGGFAALVSTQIGRQPAVALGASVAASVGFSLFARAGEGAFFDVGVKCAALEVAVALVPLGTALFLGLRGGPRGALSFAAVGATGALAGHAALHVHCPVYTAHPHVLAFHLGGVVLAALLGVALARLPGQTLRQPS